jgi:hypothetical protein
VLVKEQAALEVEWRLQGELLEELRQAGEEPSPRLRARAEQAEVDRDVPRHVAVFQTEDRRRGDRVIVTVAAEEGRPGAETVREIQGKALRAGIASHVGVSAARSNLALALPQADAALTLALSGEQGSFVDYAAMGPLRFVLDAPHTREMGQLVQDVLGPLAEYDAARQGELLQTLRRSWRPAASTPTPPSAATSTSARSSTAWRGSPRSRACRSPSRGRGPSSPSPSRCATCSPGWAGTRCPAGV